MSTFGVNLEKYLISLDEINRATDKFNRERYIGSGGFGAVYRGQLSEQWQSRTVAVKRRDADSRQGWYEFHNEIVLISKFHHENILPFIGYCDEGGEMLIVYEYASNGSLDDHLRDPHKMSCLTWPQRLEICIGAARGLHYLHSGLGEHDKVIHRDVKSANILLDGNMVAKICDFGLSKLGTTTQSDTQLYTKVAGTQFYMDPIYNESGILRKESDVYSFGVVLFEIFSGMPVYGERYIGDERQSMMNAVRRYHENEPDKVVDPCIRDQINVRSSKTFKDIAYGCISMTLSQRPALDTVIKKLEEALGIQLSIPARSSVIETIMGKLNSASPDDQRIALGEITFLTKHCDQNYDAFAKAGAIPRLAHLITPPDSSEALLDVVQLLGKCSNEAPEQSLTVLLNFSKNRSTRRIIMSSGVLPKIVQLLVKGNNEAQEHALAILLNLSLHIDYRDIIISSGAVPGIVNILEKGSNEAQEQSMAILLNFSKNRHTRGIIMSSGALPGIVQLLGKGNNEAQEHTLAILLNLSLHIDYRDIIISSGAVPGIVNILEKGSNEAQEHALTILLNLSQNEDYRDIIIFSGAIPGIVNILEKGSTVARETAADVISALSLIDGAKDTMGSSGAIPPLLLLLSEGTMIGKKKAVYCLNKLCRNYDNKGRAIAAGSVPILMELLKEPQEHAVTTLEGDLLKLLATLSEHPEGMLAIGEAGAVAHLLELLASNLHSSFWYYQQEHAVTALVNLCSMDEKYLAEAQKHGVLRILKNVQQQGTDRAKIEGRKLRRMVKHHRGSLKYFYDKITNIHL